LWQIPIIDTFFIVTKNHRDVFKHSHSFLGELSSNLHIAEKRDLIYIEPDLQSSFSYMPKPSTDLAIDIAIAWLCLADLRCLKGLTQLLVHVNEANIHSSDDPAREIWVVLPPICLQ